MGLRVRTDDEVVVISGKDRGKTGRVLQVDPVKQRVFVDGLNIVKRHQRPTPGTNQPGGVIEKPGPIHISTVALIDPKSDKPTRVGMKVMADGSRLRVATRSGLLLDK